MYSGRESDACVSMRRVGIVQPYIHTYSHINAVLPACCTSPYIAISDNSRIDTPQVARQPGLLCAAEIVTVTFFCIYFPVESQRACNLNL